MNKLTVGVRCSAHCDTPLLKFERPRFDSSRHGKSRSQLKCENYKKQIKIPSNKFYRKETQHLSNTVSIHVNQKLYQCLKVVRLHHSPIRVTFITGSRKNLIIGKTVHVQRDRGKFDQ
jgi:hypothetical protein